MSNSFKIEKSSKRKCFYFYLFFRLNTSPTFFYFFFKFNYKYLKVKFKAYDIPYALNLFNFVSNVHNLFVLID